MTRATSRKTGDGDRRDDHATSKSDDNSLVEPIVRALREEDLGEDFLDCLRHLTVVEEVSEQDLIKRLQLIESNPHHHVYVAILDGKVAGTTTLLLEPKFIRGCGWVGHIEDVATSRAHEGRGIGQTLICHAVAAAAAAGCYKVILDCAEDLRPFYEKTGFEERAVGMRRDL